MSKYTQPLTIEKFKSIYVENINAHIDANYEILHKSDDNLKSYEIVKKGNNLLDKYYVEKYLNIFNCHLNNPLYLNNLCRVFDKRCIIHYEINSQINKSITLILYRDKPEMSRLQLKHEDNIVMLKLDKPNSELIQLINGLIYI